MHATCWILEPSDVGIGKVCTIQLEELHATRKRSIERARGTLEVAIRKKHRCRPFANPSPRVQKRVRVLASPYRMHGHVCEDHRLISAVERVLSETLTCVVHSQAWRSMLHLQAQDQ